MKLITNCLFVFFIFSLMLASCGKKGITEKTGSISSAEDVWLTDAGSQNTGNQGIIYSGPENPTKAVGAVGDFYVNLNTGYLFGPKDSLGWRPANARVNENSPRHRQLK